MKLNIIILSFTLIGITGCKPEQNKKEYLPNSKSEISKSEKIPDNLAVWVDAVNSNNIKTIENFYDKNAIKVISSDNIINSATGIANFHRMRENKITTIKSLFSVQANKERGINYEFVKYKIDNLKEYVQVVIWNDNGEKIVREFEFTGESDLEATKVDTTEIAKRRKLWIELCNTNNSENLVKQLYSTNTMYYNHKPIVQGIENLIKEYDYMNDKNYTLNLLPMKLEVVNTDLAFEIGQCSGSYNGKYLLVWKKQTNGVWKIYIDSNI